MTRRPPGPRSQRGAATVLVVTFLAILLTVTSALAVVMGLFVDHRRAQSAADLSALAGAAAAGRGADACAAAGRVASSHGAQLTRCAVLGHDVRVRVSVAGPRVVSGRATLVAEARAGPG